MTVKVQDCRRYNPKAVEISQLLGSDLGSDYLAVDAWLKNYEHADFGIDALVEIFDAQVGLPSEKIKRLHENKT